MGDVTDFTNFMGAVIDRNAHVQIKREREVAPIPTPPEVADV